MLSLVPLSLHNWARAAALQLPEEQQAFLPSNLESIAEANFEPEAELYGIYLEKEMVGFAKVAVYSQVPWITRFMIDEAHQGQGHGTAALAQLVAKLRTRPHVQELRATIAKENAAAELLFARAGFTRAGELDGREFLMKLEL